MTFLHALILGIVEGITEFLPISSTGHMILVSDLLHIPESTFLSSFMISIQLGAILAVVILFGRSLLNIELWKRLIVAFIPTGIVGVLAYAFIKTLLESTIVVLWSLCVGGIILIILEIFLTRRSNVVTYLPPLNSRASTQQLISEVSYSKAFIVGIFQSLAIVPGVSRSAATISGGLILGISRVAITEFSFLLAVPTMAAATGLDLVKNYSLFSLSDIWMLILGCVVSCIVALGAISFLLRFVKTHTFIPFGIYRILLAVLFFWLVM